MNEDRLQVQPIDGEAMAEIELLAKLIVIASAADWCCCQESIDIALGAKGLPDEKLSVEHLSGPHLSDRRLSDQRLSDQRLGA